LKLDYFIGDFKLTLPADLSKFDALRAIIAKLRAPDGCPWDRKQTHASLREDFLQEWYEVLESLDEANPAKLREELGDLLLHIVLQAQIAEEAGEFKIEDVITDINEKLIFRHPHVFSTAQVKNAEEVLHNWQELKQKEKLKKGKNDSLLASVPKSLPALNYSQEIQGRVAQVGFDWKDDRGVVDKLLEEIGEFQRAATKKEKTEEIGDILFTMANIARRDGIELETALREANQKFYKRFNYMEEVCKKRGVKIGDLSFAEQNALWDEAKKHAEK
jgi:tetrapyrrole methylase family protein/MazG family protein